jgi:integrase
LPRLGKLPVNAITRQDINKLHTALRDTPTQANRVLALLSKMFSLSEKWGLRPDGTNPCRHVERYRETSRERFLSGEELARLGETLARVERERTELESVPTAVRLLIFTGARLGEILTLKWEHVDTENGLLRLPDSKTGKKLIHLGGPALEVLANASRKEGNPFVCAGIRPGAHLIGIPKAWARILKQADLQGVRLHDLRHSFASVAAGENLGLPIIGHLLGHTQPQTTARYAHLSTDPLRAAADVISRKIDEAMRQAPKRAKIVPIR